MIEDLLGKPYKDGGRGPAFFDCWGLAMEVHKRFNITLPDFEICASMTTLINDEISLQKTLSDNWLQINEPLVPCIVVIKTHPVFVQHVGVYVGDGKFIHTSSKTNVCRNKVTDLIWSRRIKGFYKYVGKT